MSSKLSTYPFEICKGCFYNMDLKSPRELTGLPPSLLSRQPPGSSLLKTANLEAPYRPVAAFPGHFRPTGYGRLTPPLPKCLSPEGTSVDLPQSLPPNRCSSTYLGCAPSRCCRGKHLQPPTTPHAEAAGVWASGGGSETDVGSVIFSQ